MTPPAIPERYKNHRFPADIISHGVWLYYRFCLSYRDVEELLFTHGVVVTYEAIRKWFRKFRQDYANQLRRQRPRPGDKWYMDEVFLTINGERHSLWQAVDQDDNVLDILVQKRRNTKVVITDKSKATARPSARCCQAWNICRAALSITAVRTPIGRRVSASVACRGSNLPVMPSASSLHTDRSPNTSDRDAICCPRRSTAKR